MFSLLVVALFAGAVFAFPAMNAKTNSGGAIQEALASGDYEAYVGTFDEADQPFMRHKMTEEQFALRTQHMQERMGFHDDMEAAIESGNYDTWRAYVDGLEFAPPMTDLITEDNFGVFVAHHEAMEAGDVATAQELAQELGFAQGMRHGNMHFQKGVGCSFHAE